MKTPEKLSDYLFKPFMYIAGKESLLIGLVVLLVLSLLSYLSSTFFDGVLDIHYAAPDAAYNLLPYFICVFTSWIILSLVMYITALVLNKKVRLVDMFGTLAMAKAPYIFATFVGLIPAMHIAIDMADLQNIDVLMSQLTAPLLSMIVIIPITIWYVVLLYNAFSVSSNLKGTKGIVGFIIALLVSEVLSVIIIPLIIKNIVV
ncbi:YIP1 family protein [Bacteroidales bacterium OttesenSCG-928-I14]|nr:YIP1 family protein [Bacteroidales bacterium OttesenSCG-928-I14]